MMQAISVLGSTGSIGRQTLDVAAKLGTRVVCLAAGQNLRPDGGPVPPVSPPPCRDGNAGGRRGPEAAPGRLRY